VNNVLIGATFKKSEIPHWQDGDKLVRNDIFRIFPNSDGVPPDWDDPRFHYCRRVGAIPFVSGQINGHPGKLRELKQRLLTMEPWVKVLYLTDHHEPEGDPGLTAQDFKDNFNAVLRMVRTELPPHIRSRIRCGPAMTKQWTEMDDERSYRDWDPGTGDFYGVDAYLNSWAPGGGTVFTKFPSAATWLKKIKSYRYDEQDRRPRILPELGAIQPPWDADGHARAAFLKDVHDEVSTWNPRTTGWEFQGWIWWNTEGTSGGSLTGAGQRRWFQLDRRHTGEPLVEKGQAGRRARTLDAEGGFHVDGGNATLRMYNAIARQEPPLLGAEPIAIEIPPVDSPAAVRI
jgi:hypothetical protein